MKRFTERAWWLGWRACVAGAFGVFAALGVTYLGATTDSTLDFGGYGDGDLSCLRETNRWWDLVHVASKDETPLQIVGRVRSIRAWEAESKAPTPASSENAALDLWPRDVMLIGWPARCMWGVDTLGLEHEREGLMDPPEWVQDRTYVQHPLPTKVWWPGMAVNAAFYGWPVLALLAGPTLTRRWRWKRRGACLGCGYDLRGVQGGVCPECGVLRESAQGRLGGRR